MSRAGGLEVRVDRPRRRRRRGVSRARVRPEGAVDVPRPALAAQARGRDIPRPPAPAPQVRAEAQEPRRRRRRGSEPSLAPSSDGSDDDDGWGPTVGLARKRHHSFNAVAIAAAIAAAHERAALEAAHEALEALGDSEEERGNSEEDFPAPRAEEEKERVTDARATSTERVARERTRERTRSRSPIRQNRVAARAKTLSPAPRGDASRRVAQTFSVFAGDGSRAVLNGGRRRAIGGTTATRGADRRARARARARRRRDGATRRRGRRADAGATEKTTGTRRESERLYYASHRDPYASPPRASPIERTCASDPRKATSSGLLQPRREEPYPTPPPRSESFPLSRWSTRTFSTVEAAAVQQTTGQPMKFKSKLCEDWTRHGRCPAGDVCGYAHGASQRETRSCRVSTRRTSLT